MFTGHIPQHVPHLGHTTGQLINHRVGGWLPCKHDTLKSWLDRKITFVEHPSRRDIPFHPVIRKFQTFIETDAVAYMGFHQMFEQVPAKYPYNKDPMCKPQVRNYILMLKLFNHIIETAPSYEGGDLVGFPINAILDWPMGTPAGMAMFSSDAVNVHFKAMFDVWAAFLTSRASCGVLTDAADGWFGSAARAAIPDFEKTYVCDPHADFHGFKSWDDFFTRQFRPGVRPVQFSADDDIINSACESTVYRIARQAKETDQFWLKGQAYSLFHMLNHDEYAKQFAGGTVYQAFLSATKYHRWHSPVNGRIVGIVTVPGTYYAESTAGGFPHPDPAAPNLSQAFITSVAARTIIYIQANNSTIGLMAFIAVGMAEVSTCEVTVKAGDEVKKGEELGMFHFGGSTHCLVFGPQVKIDFESDVGVNAEVHLNMPIATVSRA
ncbi:Phophatidylserine decarboxylase-domain-containing protein [Trametes gibbosa]|nr:Phophatidylserine decarboxylase-domain-containing protein [Trametes gibbosa]